MSIEAVIFDMGGVIVRTEDRVPRSMLAESLGLTYDQLSAIVFDSRSAQLALRGEITTAEHWENVREMLGLTAEEFPRVPEFFWGGDSLDMVLVDTLRNLQAQYKTALLSNAWDDLRGRIEDIWKIADAFDQILISSEVGLVKPDPRIYQRIIADLQVAPTEAVFVDDFEKNIDGAQKLGLYTIHFKSRQQTLRELGELLDGREIAETYE